MKRFYDQVDLIETSTGWQIALDGRGLKTAKGAPQIVPSKPLAQAMAQEWEEQPEKLDTSLFIFRDMADYGLDIVGSDRDTVVEKLLAYIETDTLCYRADPEDALFARQLETWEPLVAEVEDAYSVELVRISGIIHRPQSQATHEAFKTRLEQEDAMTLAALETLASLSASLSIALLSKDHPERAESLWQAASLEEEWQADLWGRDHEAQERREKRRRDFIKAVDFLSLARS